jgi:protein-disulfide isomerase
MSRFLRAALFAATLPLLALPGAARAADPVFTQAQRDEIVRVVRQALKADPSILRDAVVALRADDDARDARESQDAIKNNQKALLANIGDPETGNPNGDVTVVEFYDPRCPYCRKMLPGIEALLQKDHGIRLVFKDIPVLGEASIMESKAIVAAQNQHAYLKMQTALMTDPAQPSTDMIMQKARGLGLDPVKFAADMTGPAVTDRLKANLDLSRSLKVTGTPTFVVGNTVIPGMVDAGQLEQAVAEARKHAEK